MGALAAARAAVTWHARAGDLAAMHRTETNLLARDVLDSLVDVEKKTC
jgi:NAD(P)H-hydrate repair Nnr-like enzyme with NAD(P)H-hydrate dehydratase domain